MLPIARDQPQAISPGYLPISGLAKKLSKKKLRFASLLEAARPVENHGRSPPSDRPGGRILVPTAQP
jgi:hypothetical protein